MLFRAFICTYLNSYSSIKKSYNLALYWRLKNIVPYGPSVDDQKLNIRIFHLCLHYLIFDICTFTEYHFYARYITKYSVGLHC